MAQTNNMAERLALLTEIATLKQENNELRQKKNEYLDKLIAYTQKEQNEVLEKLQQVVNRKKYNTIIVPIRGGLYNSK